MALGYRPVLRDQMMLLPPDLRDWLPPRHFVWFLLAVLDEFDLTGFEADRRLGSVGRQGYDPRMLLGLLIYGYCHGQRSSRRIEELCSVDVAFRVLCAQDAPDHTTIARFRQVNDAAIADMFVQVLELAGEAGLGRVGVVAVDGTRIAANASWGRNRRRSWLAEQVDQMMSEAEQTDAAEDARFGPDANGTDVDPGWAAGSATRQQRIREALARAEQAAEQQTAAQQARVVSWQARRDEAADRLAREQAAAEKKYRDYRRRAAAAERGEGPPPQGRSTPPPDQAVGVRRAQASVNQLQARVNTAAAAAAAARAAKDPAVNLTDPESGWMPTGKGWIQGYNTQLVVSDDHLIIGCKVTTATTDVEQFEPMLVEAANGAAALDRGRARTGAPAEPIGLVLADAGYFSTHNLTVPGPDRLIAPSKRQRLNDLATDGPPADDGNGEQDPLAAMRARFTEPHDKLAYRRRGATVEPVNGHLKDRHGLRQYSRRGQAAAQAESDLTCATANLLKIWRRRH
jgi:transposase